MNSVGLLGPALGRQGRQRRGICVLCHPGVLSLEERVQLAVPLTKLPGGVMLCVGHAAGARQRRRPLGKGALKRAARRVEKAKVRAENLADRGKMKEAIAAGMAPDEAASRWSAWSAREAERKRREQASAPESKYPT